MLQIDKQTDVNKQLGKKMQTERQTEICLCICISIYTYLYRAKFDCKPELELQDMR